MYLFYEVMKRTTDSTNQRGEEFLSEVSIKNRCVYERTLKDRVFTYRRRSRSLSCIHLRRPVENAYQRELITVFSSFA